MSSLTPAIPLHAVRRPSAHTLRFRAVREAIVARVARRARVQRVLAGFVALVLVATVLGVAQAR